MLGKILNFEPKIVEKGRFLMFFGPFLAKISALIYSAACYKRKVIAEHEHEHEEKRIRSLAGDFYTLCMQGARRPCKSLGQTRIRGEEE